ALALEGDHLLGDGDLAEVEVDVRPSAKPVFAPGDDAVDEYRRLLPRLRVPVPVEGIDDRTAQVQVELPHLVGASEVEVDGAGVDRGEGALGLHRADQLPGTGLDHGNRVWRGGPQRHLAGGKPRAPRQVASVT